MILAGTLFVGLIVCFGVGCFSSHGHNGPWIGFSACVLGLVIMRVAS